jgi:hypothetical protein
MIWIKLFQNRILSRASVLEVFGVRVLSVTWSFTLKSIAHCSVYNSHDCG